VGRIGRQVHEERTAARCVPYEALGGLGVQVGVVCLGAVVGDYPTVLIDLVGGVGATVQPLPGVPLIPARRHVGTWSAVAVAVQPVAVEVLAHEDGVVSRGVEPGGYRGALQPLIKELPEPPEGSTLTHT
jgi:hypothetical protein